MTKEKHLLDAIAIAAAARHNELGADVSKDFRSRLELIRSQVESPNPTVRATFGGSMLADVVDIIDLAL